MRRSDKDEGVCVTVGVVGSAHPTGLDIFSIQDKRVPIAVGIMIGVGVGIGIGIEGQKMEFGHEKLDVYRTSIEYVGWAYRFSA
jgi:hypothetical protein